MKKLMMLVLAGMFSAGAAIANEDKLDFSELDKDGDGQLSRTEVAQNAELAAQFSTIDADGDGYLSETEAESAQMNQGEDYQEAAEEETEDYEEAAEEDQATQDY